METGCLIDTSHFSANDCNLEIIHYARRKGWDGGNYDLDTIDSDFIHIVRGTVPTEYEYDSEAFDFDYHQTLCYAADDAVEWLTENVADDGYYYTIEDNSLYYWKVEDENL